MAGHIGSAGSVEWCTPKTIIDAVKEAFGGEIGLDPCSNSESIVGAKVEYILPEHDGLTDPWDAGTIYVNPPFGKSYMHKVTREIMGAKEFQAFKKSDPAPDLSVWKQSSIVDWVNRCVDARKNLASVIALLPAAVDTKYWQETVLRNASSVCFVKGRIRFNGAAASAPMACAIVGWMPMAEDNLRFIHAFLKVGRVIDLTKGVCG